MAFKKRLKYAVLISTIVALLLWIDKGIGDPVMMEVTEWPQKSGLGEYYSETLKMGYYLYVPEDYNLKQQYPIILYLHGSNAKGNGKDELMKVMNHGLKALLYSMRDRGCLILAPQANPQWEDSKLDALLDDIMTQYSVDSRRIYLTGVSMGGMETWSYAVHGKHKLAAMVPVCGYYYFSKDVINRVKDVPIWIFHGDRDLDVPVERAYEAILMLKDINSGLKFTIMENRDHVIWNEVYMKSELYDWLLEQVARPVI